MMIEDADASEVEGELPYLEIIGAKEHNLKNINIRIPKKKFIVFTGVSGSGKTSLAFDTIFAEGQRRYIESLSSYARQFLGQLEKPKFETIRGLSPTISIEQKSAGKNPRSTVGTITEIYDYLRVLYARIGTQHCHICNKKVGKGDAQSMVERVMSLPENTAFLILAPLVENKKGEYKDLLQELLESGFTRVRLDGIICEISDVQNLAKHKKHNIDVVIDRLTCEHSQSFQGRVTDSLETALKQGNGQVVIHINGREDLHMSEARSCCGFAFPELSPPLFSFNAPLGMCQNCNGIGQVLNMDPAKIIEDENLTIRGGAVIPWRSYFQGSESNEEAWGMEIFNAMEEQWKFDWDTPWKDLPKKQKEIILFGAKDKALKVAWKRSTGHGSRVIEFEGLVHILMRRYKSTQSEEMKTWYEKFMTGSQCKSCHGKRLKTEVLSIKIGDKSIIDFTELTPVEARKFFAQLNLTGNAEIIGKDLIKEVDNRLGFLVNVGLDYLTLDRRGPTLSGGEAQRLRLASQIGSELSGVLYILDEPSIGLHQRDNSKLLATLFRLRNIGNTVIVVEHDLETIESADFILDFGPQAGHLGGQIVASGTPSEIRNNPNSITGKYLNKKLSIAVPGTRRKPKNGWLEIHKPAENNLKMDLCKFPLGLFTCVTGVSGAGKSSLINQILTPALQNQISGSKLRVGAHAKIVGIEKLDKVIEINQSPIGRTPRSNPSTYTKVFDLIRDLFSNLPEAQIRGFSKGRFSFNVKGGRCEHCQGDGLIKVEMHFLADVYVTCEICKGKRFNLQTLEVKYKTHSIADILDLSITQARDLFSHHSKITAILDTIIAVGLGYIKLGQQATTLSGGEAQRLKLSRELAKRPSGKTIYILDEPTTGLHFDDIKKLLSVLNTLVEAGNTVIVVEHNLDVIKVADWIIDLGPEGGNKGGYIIGEGTPETLAKSSKSYTGQYLKKVL